ncbi:hypothetical protein CAPTEDRAFT_178643 [Capitella teleta]|uniref:ABC transporter domain-containing protein n=1 Tax=Capitella teleta TaxID=283909 RepID=R7VGN0_CAPTE|nr:hypothetical protein CAPTEDRAFT_178643 [Capitella teleta]|eukprot:ELU14850.1 hypothetical protein CAPTEDRAFT_178643 [Capitella teleta]
METTRKDGNVISFHDVNYDVQIKGDKRCGPKRTKHVLTSVKGMFKPGMNAIMGPTGSGKSSLLDVIAGRKDPRGLSGTLLIDGQAQPKNYKCISGYVVQDDIVMGTLTVRENILFSANLRLPSTVSEKEKEVRVDEVISELGLEKCADTKVGTEFIRGVSGGERKRTNIGMELVVSQAVLFLDEPTTGLDASTANSVMRLLKKLSLAGRTIVFSIHQPRYSIFRLFDRLMLLSQGKPIYHGPAQEGIDFFQSIGYECEARNNPPDFFLDVILGDIAPTEENALEDVSPAEKQHRKDLRDLIFIYKSVLARCIPWEVYRCCEVSALGYYYKLGETDLFCSQFKTLSGRGLKNLTRNPFGAIMQVIILAFMGIVVGILYFQLGLDISDIQNRQGAFFFITMNMVFSNVSAVSVFISERAMFLHENVSGFYRVSAFFLSKVISDLIPLRIVPVTAYAIITYFMAGFQIEAGKFFIYYLNLFLVTMTAASICFWTSCMSGIFAIANLLTILVFVLMLVFGGLFVNLNTLAGWLGWIQYLSLFRYSLKVFYVNEMKDMIFTRAVGVNGTIITQTGNDYLDEQGIEYGTAWDLWQNHLALVLMTVFFLVLAYIRLRTMNKLK